MLVEAGQPLEVMQATARHPDNVKFLITCVRNTKRAFWHTAGKGCRHITSPQLTPLLWHRPPLMEDHHLLQWKEMVSDAANGSLTV